MKGSQGNASLTLIDALLASIESAQRAPEGVVSPVAILWTDAEGQWRPLLPVLQKACAHLYVLGDYAPAQRTGPAIWLKRVVDRTLPDIAPPEGTVPILYLPGVSRQELRAGGDCPARLHPLIELQYRGAVWHQKNGRDWSVEAFLTSDSALGLDMALDARAREALMRALPALASEPIAQLRGHRLDADDFDRLTVGDPIRDLLSWMSAPQPFQDRWEAGRWQTFRNICTRDFGFDPEREGPSAAADGLLNGSGGWDEVWRRFRDSPRAYAGVAELLRTAQPRDLLADQSRQPMVNDAAEGELRSSLRSAIGLSHDDACRRILELEATHGERRKWVWADMGLSPLARALAPLARLAELAQSPLGGVSAEGIARDYAANGWRCDRAAMESLAEPRSAADSALVAKVVAALYAPWLDKSARHFQDVVAKDEKGYRDLIRGVASEADTCVLFADGLRFDIGGVLQETLEARGLRGILSHRLAPLPTVTATAKPVASPAHAAFEAGMSAEEFAPVLVLSKQPLTASRLRDEMVRRGVKILDPEETNLAAKTENGGWTEIGRLDELGHSLGTVLVRQIEMEIEAIADRVAVLLASGWSRVRIVTDHGWLLMPGGLPKVELPHYLVATRWARCAAMKGESRTTVPAYSWHWDPNARIASPPGIGSFKAGIEYAHGGVSVQECVVPELLVERGEAAIKAQITDISWRGMRCRLTVETNTAGLRVELRRSWKQPDPENQRIAAVKELGEIKGTAGQASLAVEDDTYEGLAAMAVVLGPDGRVLDYRSTTIGES